MATQPEMYGTGNSESRENAHLIHPPAEASDIESADRAVLWTLELRSTGIGGLIVSIKVWVNYQYLDSLKLQL
jgi:hypothetical protein